MTLFEKSIAIAAFALSGTTVAGQTQAHAQEAYIGEIREFPYQFCPRNWTEADGRLMPIAQNQALFSLLGTTYGGDGRVRFALPDMRREGPAPAASTGNSTTGEVKIYQHCAYGGWGQSLGLGAYKPGEFGRNASFVTQDASSVKVPDGWEVTLYSGPNFDGNSVSLTRDTSCLVGENFNDQAMSVRVKRISAPAPVSEQRAKVKTCIAVAGIYPSRN